MGDRIDTSGTVHFLDPKLPLMVLRRMEADIEREAREEIKRRGLEIIVIRNSRDYEDNLKLMHNGHNGGHKVYVHCDSEGNLIDLRPLLDFVPKEQKEAYIKYKDMYLNPN